VSRTSPAIPSAASLPQAARSPLLLASFNSFYFVGDGDPTPAGKQQAPKRGCFEVDDGCKNCLESWRKYPPDASYDYQPIRDNEGCNGTIKKGIIPCPPGLDFYQWF